MRILFVTPPRVCLGRTDDWTSQKDLIPTKYLSIEDVGRLGAWCMREFYSKPERIHRIMQSDYDELAKLCVKDFMSNILKFETASKGERTYV